MIKNSDKLVSSFTAAKLLGFTPDYIRRMILQGKIKAIKVGHSWIIDIKDLRNIKRQRYSKKKELTNVEGTMGL